MESPPWQEEIRPSRGAGIDPAAGNGERMKALHAALALVLCLTAGGAARAAALRVLFEAPWDPAPRPQFAQRLAGADVFAPQWLTLTAADGTIVVADDPAARTALKQRPRVAVMPVVVNAHDGVWDTAAAGAAIADPAVRDHVLDQLAALARTHRFKGYLFDFEALTPESAAAYPAFLTAARGRLGKAGVAVWVTAPLSADPLALAALAGAADSVVLMAYDECWATSTPGPVAGQDWLEFMLASRLPAAGGKRAIVALGAYAYDWPANGPAAVRSVTEAQALAAAHSAPIVRDLATANATFRYTAQDGAAHEVWMTDAVTWAWERAAMHASGARGYALWRLGLEDPAIWSTPAAGAVYAAGVVPKLPRCFLLAPAPMVSGG